MPPIFSNLSPSYYSWNLPFDITATAYDTSGIWDENAYLLWDVDGNIDDGSYNIIPIIVDSVISPTEVVLATQYQLPPQPLGTVITYRICAYDNDFDFLAPEDRTLGCIDSVVIILEGPHAYPIEPLPLTVTACSNQGIYIAVIDSEGVQPSSLVLQVNDSIYTIDDPRLTFDDSLLIFQPDSGYFNNNEQVEVALLSASDLLGNPMFDTLSYAFYVDLEPPAYQFLYPGTGTMVREAGSPVTIGITDNLAGVNPDSIYLTVGSDTLDVASCLTWNADAGRLIFVPSRCGLRFVQGDTISLSVRSADKPDYCGPNWSESAVWWYFIEPAIPCGIHPNPFTPNGDGFNDFVVFDYPYMFSERAELIIYDRWNREIWHSNIGPVNSFFSHSLRKWDGKDDSGSEVESGVYIYVIIVDGEVVCNGSVTVAR